MPWRAVVAGAALVLGIAATAPAMAQAPEPAGAAPESGARGRLQEIVARGVLRVGMTGDYTPFSYRRGHGDTFVGLDVELAGDLARSLGVSLQVVPTTWPSLMSDFTGGRFDVASGGVSVTLERQRRGLFSIPYLRDGKTPIVRCPDQSRFRELAQIDQPGVRLIVNPGGTNERFARAHAPHAQLIVDPDNVGIFDRIVVGDADLMITDSTEARLQQRLHPQLCAVHPEAPFDFSEKAFLLPQDPVFKAYVDQWLHMAIETGFLGRSIERWLAYPWNVEALRELVDARLLLAPDVARAKWTRHEAIEDVAREQAVIEAAGRQAAAFGLPRARVEAFFRAQVEASKTIQRALFARWTSQGQGGFADAPDLAAALRPQFDRLTPRLLRALADADAALRDAGRRGDVEAILQALRARDVDRDAAAQAIAPLLE
ncbi:MAG TPA: gamma subclass chorismate mutase AroQ [Burkholderiaceae bacterium]|nr:gamma subclass chorismate mutase AroQ [Burkholderiaceae bacterium]